MDFKIPDDWRYMRVKEELDNGRLWKARDRLLGKIADQPANQDVLGLLGDVFFAMGDLPQAGRYWWLTERDDDRAAAGREAFHERYGKDPYAFVRALPTKLALEAYPDAVRARLDDFIHEDSLNRLAWASRPLTPRAALDGGWEDVQPTWRDRLTSPEFLGFLLVLILALAAFGLVTLVSGVIGIVT
jgi:hypothetical protein